MWYHMAIGRYRDDPEEMDAIEQAVAAAQYPEGALVAGAGLGIAVSLLVAPLFSAIGGIVGGVVGYNCGRLYRRQKLRQRRARSLDAE